MRNPRTSSERHVIRATRPPPLPRSQTGHQPGPGRRTPRHHRRRDRRHDRRRRGRRQRPAQHRTGRPRHRHRRPWLHETLRQPQRWERRALQSQLLRAAHFPRFRRRQTGRQVGSSRRARRTRARHRSFQLCPSTSDHHSDHSWSSLSLPPPAPAPQQQLRSSRDPWQSQQPCYRLPPHHPQLQLQLQLQWWEQKRTRKLRSWMRPRGRLLQSTPGSAGRGACLPCGGGPSGRCAAPRRRRRR
mmetsp:Transcript_11394/g.44049  ORF Transcript_11394/g.44049 Transcript_11394/m.44049 type:complete len:243 (-) Transcript_11394:944-1672(-)